MTVDLRKVAQQHVNDPLNTWPDHNRVHSKTLLYNLLFDEECLRCWLEKLAAEE